MQLFNISSVFNLQVALQKARLLPVKTVEKSFPTACINCSFINRNSNNFCTNCGYPINPDAEKLSIYHQQVQQRRNQQRICLVKIEHARNALYVIAAFSMLGIFYVFSDVRQKVNTGLVMVILGVIYAGLGRWSRQKPFTALLISLIIMLTFAAINTWAELSSMYTTVSGAYLIVIQGILIYFLLQGVKGAFRADILEEEFKM